MSDEPIEVCPCCGWGGYKTAPLTADEAILACEWCTTNMNGQPHLCAQAKKAAERVAQWKAERAQQ